MSSEYIETASVIDSAISVLDSFVQSAMYTGFNPIVLRHYIKTKEPNQYRRDVPALLALFLQRGSRISKALSTMSQEGQDKVTALIQQYNVRDTGNLSRTDVSLPRLAAAFPELTVYLLDRKPGYLSMTFPDYLDSIPAFMKVSCFASVIPDDESYLSEILQKAHLNIMHELDNIINGSFADQSRVKQFWDIAFKSKMFTTSGRYSILAQMPKWFQLGKNGIEMTASMEDALIDAGYISGGEPEDLGEGTSAKLQESSAQSSLLPGDEEDVRMTEFSTGEI